MSDDDLTTRRKSEDSSRASVPLDPRAAGFASAKYEILVDAANRWPAPERAPDAVQEMLRIARSLFAHGPFVWEFFAVACSWSLIGVELAIRDVTQAGDRVQLRRLIAARLA